MKINKRKIILVEGVEYFFHVSPLKLAVLSFSTLGLYCWFWFFENWRAIRKQEHSKIWPYWRTLLTLFYGFILFRKIEVSAQKLGCSSKIRPEILFGVYLLFWFSLFLPDPWWLVALFSFLPLLPLQQTIKCNNQRIDYQFCANKSFNPAEIAFGVLGLIALSYLVSKMSL